MSAAGAVHDKEATTVEIHGVPLKCTVCRNRYFFRRSVMLNTRLATILDVDWINQDATCVICDHCGYIHWFLPPTTESNQSASTT